MLSDALESFIQIFSPPFRKVMWKSLGLTSMVLFLLGLGLDRLASSLMRRHDHCGLRRCSSSESVYASLCNRVHDAEDEARRLSEDMPSCGGNGVALAGAIK
jgi:hypothetical protein